MTSQPTPQTSKSKSRTSSETKQPCKSASTRRSLSSKPSPKTSTTSPTSCPTDSVSHTLAACAEPLTAKEMDTSPPPWSYMIGIAKRIAPFRSEAWEDMAQEGYELWIRSAAKYDPSYGVPAKRFIYPIIVHQMRRAMRRDAAATLGTSLSSLQRGGGTERRVYLDEELHPDGVESLSSHDAPTPEELVAEAQMTWQARRAIWRAAEEMKVSASCWRYAFMRDCILTDRVRYTDMLERYGKRPGSLNFFRMRLLDRAKELA